MKKVKTEYDDNYDYEPEYVGGKKKIPLTHRTVAKVTAFILAIIMTIIAGASVVGGMLMIDEGMYTMSQEYFKETAYRNIAINEVYEFLNFFDTDMKSSAKSYFDYNDSIYSVEFINAKKQTVFKHKKENTQEEVYNFTYYYGDDYYLYVNDEGSLLSEVKVSVYQTQPEDSRYALAANVIEFCYSIRYTVFVVAFVALISVIALIAFLLCASGHRKGKAEVQPGWGTGIPFDLLTVVIGIATLFAIEVFANFTANDVLVAVMIVIFATVGMMVLLGWLMSFAVRIKLGKWWQNTIIYRVIILALKIVKFIFRVLRKIARKICNLVKDVPLIWQTGVVVAVISIVNLIFGYCSWGEFDNFVVYWLFSTIIIGGGVMCIAMILKKLQNAGEALADGDLTHQIDTSRLFGDFKKHGDSLNSIAQGMNLAVEERMKSERMKTELITNVSHDIKTPLTSIINYTDLISKEPCNNEKITEYSQVLLRQSERLKRLIEDLVEASKASTGNLEVNLAPCDANIFLTQAVGEYEEKLANKDLQLMTTYCDTAVNIMADGRRLWRVFDNLMNNVCKYAQPYTRVYLSLEKQGNNAVITLKNTSALPLNISADELMERFVRGDSSRNTEGNGLGLSIAKSLTELQKGTLKLFIDGDLFKVVLSFPII